MGAESISMRGQTACFKRAASRTSESERNSDDAPMARGRVRDEYQLAQARSPYTMAPTIRRERPPVNRNSTEAPSTRETSAPAGSVCGKGLDYYLFKLGGLFEGGSTAITSACDFYYLLSE
jgi:hypothetical protein